MTAQEYLEKHWLVLEAALNIRVSQLKELEREASKPTLLGGRPMVAEHYAKLRKQAQLTWAEFYAEVSDTGEPQPPEDL